MLALSRRNVKTCTQEPELKRLCNQAAGRREEFTCAIVNMNQEKNMGGTLPPQFASRHYFVVLAFIQHVHTAAQRKDLACQPANALFDDVVYVFLLHILLSRPPRGVVSRKFWGSKGKRGPLPIFRRRPSADAEKCIVMAHRHDPLRFDSTA